MLAAMLLAAAQQGSPGDEWRITVEPYVWLARISGDASAEDSPTASVDSSLHLDSAFFLSAEARRGEDGFGLLADGLHLRVSDEDGALHTKIGAGMVEAGALWSAGFAKGLDILAGLRFVDLSVDVDLAGVRAGSGSATWVDPWVGARERIPIGGAWSAIVRGDVGGFGVGSEFSWQGMAGVRAECSDHVLVDIGYRALGIDYEDHELAFDAIVHGPVIGLAFRF
jgi:opacity protein-like surface antigen